ncbi:hypothetical protein Pmani_027129 [Petrolisthes manimaculis]|uniref:Delta(3,5)-Delta(2,4)-dienoyl-CoA isomerase, mitochondrial n=1 Tax=Petrolisthes manimaculis TaxID=1843537 RepID=A0AAE1P232_9EUCA|nr:hypothetical protein Pmani_027129 [Petrolisthes manimaculis]
MASRVLSALSGLRSVRAVPSLAATMSTTTTQELIPGYSYDTLAISQPSQHVFQVNINRPKNLNAMNKAFWREIREVFEQLGADSECRAVVLAANGRMFTAGIDLSEMADIGGMVMGDDDVARKARGVMPIIAAYQASFTALEKCPKPVVAAVHSACIGGGVDLICAADIRYCSDDAWFQVKEVDVGLAADVGTLQRLPKIVGNESLVRELAFSARKMYSAEALKCGLVSRIFPNYESLVSGAVEIATTIASKSPVAVQTSKAALIHARDHSVQEGLDYIATLNMMMLQSEDLRLAAMAAMSKEKPTFSKL